MSCRCPADILSTTLFRCPLDVLKKSRPLRCFDVLQMSFSCHVYCTVEMSCWYPFNVLSTAPFMPCRCPSDVLSVVYGSDFLSFVISLFFVIRYIIFHWTFPLCHLLLVLWDLSFAICHLVLLPLPKKSLRRGKKTRSPTRVQILRLVKEKKHFFLQQD